MGMTVAEKILARASGLPSVKAGDVVKVKVLDVDIARKRIALSMRLGETVVLKGVACRVIGVLGENAPEPFAWNSKAQSLTWDGKDDQDVYVDDKESLTVRVSLGLRPQFERPIDRRVRCVQFPLRR